MDPQWPLAAAKIERLQQSRQTQPMICMEVGQEHLRQLGQPDRADELALRALAAVDQDPVSAATHKEGGKSASSGWDRPGCAGKEQ